MEKGPPDSGHGERERPSWGGASWGGGSWRAEKAARRAEHRARKIAERQRRMGWPRYPGAPHGWPRGWPGSPPAGWPGGPHAGSSGGPPAGWSGGPHAGWSGGAPTGWSGGPHAGSSGGPPAGWPGGAGADGCGVPSEPPTRGRGRGRRVNGPWAMHQLEESDRGPGPAIVAAIAQVAGCSLAEAPVPPVGYALLLLGPLALLLGRRRPAVTLAVAVAATVAFEVAGMPGAPTFVAALIALVRAVRAGRRSQARWILLAGFVAFVAGGLVTGEASWGHAAAMGAWTLVAYGFAEANRARVAQMVAIAKAHAEEERAVAERERAAEEQKRRQASDERLRIARELHDVLGHHLSLINVQAGVGLHLLDEHPEQAKTALAAIKQASSEALGEVRGVLAALRPEGEAAPKAPAPGLAEVEELAAAAGLPVVFTIEGTPEALPPELDRAAYRIVQEALTNVRRHAGPAAEASLTVAYSPDRLRVQVVNTGSVDPRARLGEGNGIAGMRERATALGGTLRAGPRAEGGFEVVADLPVRGAT